MDLAGKENSESSPGFGNWDDGQIICSGYSAGGSGRTMQLLKVDEITWIEAQGNYVRVHHDKGSQLVKETIGTLERSTQSA